jgi:acetyl-CoA synthetase
MTTMTKEPTERSIESLMTEDRTFPPSDEMRANSYISSVEQYEEMWRQSIDEPDTFWLEQAKSLSWFQEPTKSLEYLWDTEARRIEHTWFEDGILNVSYNCLDRHMGTPIENKTAILWQGEEEDSVERLTYGDMFDRVQRFANVLKARGIGKGDRVAIYMPMVPEASVAMLACARIGAIHSVIFGGFSAEAIRGRVNDSDCKMIITANLLRRSGKKILLKDIVDEAVKGTPSVESVVVVYTGDQDCLMEEGRDFWYHEEMEKVDAECEPEPMQAEDALFILYTSGSTGKPKGVVHTTGGYLLQVAMTHKLTFNIHEDDVYWCTADIGWVTGHSYIVYGPMANGATSLMFEGVPTYPDAGRFWQICAKFGVTAFYTAPTAIRALMRLGEEWPAKHNLDSLRILGTVGEPINPEAWIWYHKNIGHEKCPIVDTWWQTETGGFMITPLPGAHTLKPGSASRPFFGVDTVLLRDDATECDRNEGGKLCIRKPWPGMMRTMWGDHERFVDTYFTTFADMYFTGDGCRIDEDGDYWLMGRIDDVVNISGHRLGTAEIESALVSHVLVAEAAVTPIPHEIKGQGLYCFVTLVEGAESTDELRRELIAHIRTEIGPIATPEGIQFAPSLPKTRSGKIMRRILRKVAEKDTGNLGDTSTLADPTVVDSLIAERG